MKNQDLKSGLFGSIGENMVAFELAKRNWYVYRPYFDTRIDFIAQKFICKKCLSDWDSKHIVICSKEACDNHNKSLNNKNYIKTRKCTECGFIFDKYSEEMNCPECDSIMSINKKRSSGQRNYKFKCNNCNKEFTSQTRNCVKCNSTESIEFPICKICKSEIIPQKSKCDNIGCDSNEYAMIFRTIQIKSSHEEEKGTIGFNFKVQDLIDDIRHFLVVYSRTFEDFKEKHNYWVMSVEEFKDIYVQENASTMIYQNARLHPPAKGSNTYFDEVGYNKLIDELKESKSSQEIDKRKEIEDKIQEVDVFGKINKNLDGDF